MKTFLQNILISAALCMAFFSASGQGIAVNNNGAPPDSSAILDIQSSDKGVLFPRLSTWQIRNIPAPETGLMVFNLDSLELYIFTGSVWESVRNATDTISIWACGKSFSYGGQVYNTVHIGAQCWMAENLNIGRMNDLFLPSTDNDTIEKYCFNGNPANCAIYGGLYEWWEMMNWISIEPTQGICPSGWIIPSDEDWKILEGNVDSQYGVGDPAWDYTNWRGLDGGDHIKSTTNWVEDGNGTDIFNFRALPAGIKSNGYYGGLEWDSYFWTSTEIGYNSYTYWMHGLYFAQDNIYRSNLNYYDGCSVRCLKND